MKVKVVERAPFHMAGAVHYGRMRRRADRRAYHRRGGHTNNENNNFEMPDFESAFNKFGEAMQNFGKHIEKNAPSWNRDIKDFGENFDKRSETFGSRVDNWADDFGRRMDNWGNTFGKKMEAWGNDFGKRMDEWGEEFGSRMHKWGQDFDKNMQRWGDNVDARWEETWHADDIQAAEMDMNFERYPVYMNYMNIYNNILKDSAKVQNSDYYYEVQVLEGNDVTGEPMVMIASELSEPASFNYPVVSMTFDADKWLIVKVTKEEFDKDWMGQLETHEFLEEYNLEPYFIIRHRFDESQDTIKIFCPLRNKDDDSEAV